jgi:hypothetical protein
MRRRVLALATAIGFAAGGSAAVAATAATAEHRSAAPGLAAQCTYGRVGGVVKCLRAGEYCARRYQRQYIRYGFTCSKRDYRGAWHLERL